jgi:hypothetical protein
MSDNTTQKAPDPDKGEVLNILQTLSEMSEMAKLIAQEGGTQ